MVKFPIFQKHDVLQQKIKLTRINCQMPFLCVLLNKTCTVMALIFFFPSKNNKQTNKHQKKKKFSSLISFTLYFALLIARLKNHQPCVTGTTAEGITTKKEVMRQDNDS